jgi:hypothetical protein
MVPHQLEGLSRSHPEEAQVLPVVLCPFSLRMVVPKATAEPRQSHRAMLQMVLRGASVLLPVLLLKTEARLVSSPVPLLLEPLVVSACRLVTLLDLAVVVQ